MRVYVPAGADFGCSVDVECFPLDVLSRIFDDFCGIFGSEHTIFNFTNLIRTTEKLDAIDRIKLSSKNSKFDL